MKPSDTFIPAPPEMIEKMLVRTGYNKDVDKEFSKMTEEGKFDSIIFLEKAVFLCMED